MTYKTNKQLTKMILDFRQVDEAYRIVRRYGEIIGCNEWEEAEGHYKGCNLAIQIRYRDATYDFELLNGEVRSVSQKMD
jgi:hypothetical protein